LAYVLVILNPLIHIVIARPVRAIQRHTAYRQCDGAHIAGGLTSFLKKLLTPLWYSSQA